jgi:two-component system CheB/CheR fusion protein
MLPTTDGEPPFRVLLVDRSEETRDLFGSLLLSLGYEVRSVSTGSEALALVPLFRPRAVVTSIFLPDRSGFELCRALRSMPETADARIVAITGHITHNSIELAQEAGFDHYLVKPVNFETILAAIQPPARRPTSA